MPYSFVIFPERALFVVTCTGVVTDADLYDFRASIMVEPRLEQAVKRIYDVRQVSKATFSPFTFWRMLSSGEPPPGTMRAFVLPPGGVKSWAYRTALRMSIIGNSSRIFHEMREALDWLQLEHDEVFTSEAAKRVGDIP